MDWYSAQNFCLSYGKNLVSFKDFGIHFTVPGGCNTYSGSYSCNVTEDDWTTLKTKFGSVSFWPWTKDVVPGTHQRAYALDFTRENPYVYVYERNGGRYALCR